VLHTNLMRHVSFESHSSLIRVSFVVLHSYVSHSYVVSFEYESHSYVVSYESHSYVVSFESHSSLIRRATYIRMSSCFIRMSLNAHESHSSHVHVFVDSAERSPSES